MILAAASGHPAVSLINLDGAAAIIGFRHLGPRYEAKGWVHQNNSVGGPILWEGVVHRSARLAQEAEDASRLI